MEITPLKSKQVLLCVIILVALPQRVFQAYFANEKVVEIISKVETNAAITVIQDISENENPHFVDCLAAAKKDTPFLIQASILGLTLNLSGEIIKHGWRSRKWRLENTILISTSSLTFASGLLFLYGPNVSETTNIFLLLPLPEFTSQNGTSRFQRDLAFGKMYAKLTLLLYKEDGAISAQVICPLCPNVLEPPLITTTTSSSLNILHKKYNRGNGHGSIAKLCRIGFRGNVHDTAYHKNVETRARWKYDPRMDKVGVSLGILINLFNFTVVMEEWDGEEGNFSGIYLNPGGDMPVRHTFGRALTLSYIISEFLLYCRKVPIIAATGWDFIWSAFDGFIWLSIFLTGVVFSLIHGGKVSYGLDVFWGVLGLPFTSDWRKSKVLSFFLVSLLNLNVGYLSVITSKVIIPNKEADVETPLQLILQGFRFLEFNITTGGPNFLKYWHQAFLENKINDSDPSNVLVQVPRGSCLFTHQPACIALNAGLGIGVIYSHVKVQKILEVPADMRDRCHGVRKPFRVFWVSFYFQGPLAQELYQTQQALVTSGIENFWDKLEKYMSVYVAHRKANNSGSEALSNSEPPPLNFQTPVLVVFKAFGALLGICISSFILELGFHRCAKICSKSREKLIEDKDESKYINPEGDFPLWGRGRTPKVIFVSTDGIFGPTSQFRNKNGQTQNITFSW